MDQDSKPAARQPFRKSDVEGQPVDPWLYLRILMSRRWLVLTCIVLAVAFAAVKLRQAEPLYKSTCTIKIESPVSKLTQLNTMDSGAASEAQEDMMTQVAVIKSSKVALRVVDALDLRPKPGNDGPPQRKSAVQLVKGAISGAVNWVKSSLVTFKTVEKDPVEVATENAVDDLLWRVSAKQQSGTKLIDVTVTHSDPEMAAILADEFCTQYINFLREENDNSFLYATKWITEHTTKAKERLEKAEKQLNEYTGQYDTRVMEKNLEIAGNSMTELSAKIQELKSTAALAEAQDQGVKTEDVRGLLLSRNPEYSDLRKRLADLEQQRTVLAVNNKPEFEGLKKVENEIEALKGQITKKEETILQKSKGEGRLAKLELDRLQPLLREQEASVQKIQADMIQFRVLQRDVESATEFYKTLLDRSREVGATAEIEPLNISILNKAKIPGQADFPRVNRTIILFAFWGFAIGAGLAYLLYKRSVKDPQRVEETIGLVPLGSIPFLDAIRTGGFSLWKRKKARPGFFHTLRDRLVTPEDDIDDDSSQATPPRRAFFSSPIRRMEEFVTRLAKNKKEQILLPAETRSTSAQFEPFRFLRSQLQYSIPGKTPQAILVTSSIPKEGKSTVAVNLAVAYAGRGQKTILVDADLKSPILHKGFDTGKSPGLSEVLTSQEDLDWVIKGTTIENLSILTAGHSTPSPVDLLESQTMDDLLDVLRDQFGIIIIDSAALLESTESIALSKIVDGTFIVVNPSRTNMESLKRGVISLRRKNIRLLGAVYNDGPAGIHPVLNVLLWLGLRLRLRLRLRAWLRARSEDRRRLAATGPQNGLRNQSAQKEADVKSLDRDVA